MTRLHIDPRSLALGCVEQVLEKGRDIQETLDVHLSQARTKGLDPRDAGLATELAYGYLRLKPRVDYVAQGFLRKPKGVPPGLLTLLGFATYGLQYLERVPAYATVDWAVTRAGKRFGENLSRLANAVLRKVADLGEDAKEPDFFRRRGDTQAAFLSRYWACPQWVVNVWLEHYGPDQTQCYLAAQAAPPLLGLRCNRRHSGYQGLFETLDQHPDRIQVLEPGVALRTGADVPNLPHLLEQGALSRQSLASLQALMALELPTTGTLWDLCSGHGGKTCALLETTNLEIMASDTHLGRLKGLRRELQRLGLPSIPVFRHSADAPAPLRCRPDAIFVDAPCSGLGVLSRRPDAKWRRAPKDVRTLANLQARILDQAAQTLPPGGVIGYVTCTLHPEENQKQVRRFLKEHTEFREGASVEHSSGLPPQ